MDLNEIIYAFAIKKYNKKLIVRVTLKEKWIKENLYLNSISDELRRTMDYLGYDYTGDDYFEYEEFQIKHNREDIEDVINQLNKYPLLEYDKDFNDLVLTSYYSVNKNPNGGFRLYVIPKTYWLDNNRRENKPADTHIYDFLTSVGFVEEYNGIFRPTIEMDEDEIFKRIKDFEYLQYDTDIYDYANMGFS